MLIKTNDDKIIDHEIFHFPDGEVQIKLGEFSHKDVINVICRVTNAEELFILDQVMDILDRHEVIYNVKVTYMMGLRMDRIMDFNRPFTLKVVADTLNKHHPETFDILEPHSDKVWNYFFPHRSILIDSYCDVQLAEACDGKQIIIPDAGAAERYKYLTNHNVIFCEKVRDVATGQITSLKIKNPEAIDNDNLIIIDDLCDGGGTFCGLYDEFMKINPELTIDLYVTHMVNSAGMERVYNKFNHVYTTNSYYDWSPCSRSTIYNVLS